MGADTGDAIDAQLETNNILVQLLGKVSTLTKLSQPPATALVTAEFFTIKISDADVPVMLMGQDGQRTRALIRASTADVFVGRQSNLASFAYGVGLPQGYILPTQQGDEFVNPEEIFVAYRPSAGSTGAVAYVSVLVERLG